MVDLAAMNATKKPLQTTLTVRGAKGEVTLCQCSRCGNIWKPRASNPNPSKCPSCFSALWNVERAYQRAGEEAPTRKARPRGKPFESGFDERRGERNPPPPDPK